MSSDIWDASSDDLLEKYGLRAGRLVAQAASTDSDSDPKGVLAGLRRHRGLLADAAQTSDVEFLEVVRLAVSLINKLEGSPTAVPPLDGRELSDVVDEVSRELDEAGNPHQAAAAFLRLSWMAALADREITGLALLYESARQSAEFTRENAWLIEPSMANFLDREGSNKYAAGDRSRAIEYYVRALGYWASVHRDGPVEALLSRMADVAPDADDAALVDVVAALSQQAPALAQVTGRTADDLQSQIYAGLILAMLQADRLNSELLWILVQLGSGLRTSMMIAAPRMELGNDHRLAALLEQLAVDRRRTLNLPPRAAIPAERASLRRAFESIRETLIVESLPSAGFRTLDELRAVIGSETVVVAPYTLRHPSCEPVHLGYVVWDSDQLLVADAAGLPELVERLDDTLRELRAAGKTHLCLVGPVGSSGASPHLVPVTSGVLADDWLVTSMPHPVLIRGEPDVIPPRTQDVLAFGLGFAAGERGQDPILDAPAEAEAIAGLFDADSLVDGAATVDAFRERAPGARYLHIATHGRFSAETPSFHELLLAPGEQGDEALYAWEIAELDLHGVELVTLSACESASASVDAYGNVEGLPVAFLRAGVGTVIGTLWDIETTCTRTFFELLYAALAEGRSRGEAFRLALAETRGKYPDPQDWPAFFLVGDWR